MKSEPPSHTLPIGNQTVTYQYFPEFDALTILFRPTEQPTFDEPIPSRPNIALRRDTATGEVVGIRIKSVQGELLAHLVSDLAHMVLSPPAPASVPSTAQPPAPEYGVDAAPAAQPAAATAFAAEEWPAPADVSTDQLGDRRTKRRRKRKKRPATLLGGPQELADATADDNFVVLSESDDWPAAAPGTTSPDEWPTASSSDDWPAAALTDYSDFASSDARDDSTANMPEVASAETLDVVATDPSYAAFDDALDDLQFDDPYVATADAQDAVPVEWFDDSPADWLDDSPADAPDAPPADWPGDSHSDAPDIRPAAWPGDLSADRPDDSTADAPDESPADWPNDAHADPTNAPPAYVLDDSPVDDSPVDELDEPPADWLDESPFDSLNRLPDLLQMPPAESSNPVDEEGQAAESAHTPPPSFASFDLHPAVAAAIARAGYTVPTPIQRRAIPLGTSGRDLIGLAQTGTGKTLAFMAPAVHRLLSSPADGHHTRLLVLEPTRELAVQVAELAETLVQGTSLSVATVYGGAGMDKQTAALKHGAEIVIATPGRLQDHMKRKHVKLDRVDIAVLDEFDRMLDMGFIDDVHAIFRHLPSDRQTLLFGATLPQEIQRLSAQFQRNPDIMEVARQLPPANIQQILVPLGRHLKEPMLVHLLNTDPTMSTVLVFTETKAAADVLARQLTESGIRIAVMHGDRQQRDRERALEEFRSGKVRVLVATNVAARGLDIDGVSHVVNFDMPQSVDDYVHRIGRTARAGATGHAYTFVTLGDEPMVDRIESALERHLPRERVPGFDYDVPVPSWAGPSPKELTAQLNRSKTVADFSRTVRLRR